MPPGIPQMTHRLKTYDEWFGGLGIPLPPTKGFETSPITLENKIDYLLNVIVMLNMCVNEEGLKDMKEAQKKLFVKRDDIYFDEQHKQHFLKEDKLK